LRGAAAAAKETVREAATCPSAGVVAVTVAEARREVYVPWPSRLGRDFADSFNGS
jgi:hypothetical protein